MTMQSATSHDDRYDVDDATQWVARLRAHDLKPIERAAFIEWFADHEHRREFDELLRVWERLGCIANFDL